MEKKPNTRANLFVLVGIFLVLTFLAMGDVLETVPFLGPVVSSPLFPFFHESYDTLALLLVVYAAHKLSPVAGWVGVAWFIALHINHLIIIFPNDVPGLVQLAIFLAAAILGIRIITIRKRLEQQLRDLVIEMDSKRSAAFQRADELTILNGIATMGVEATNVDKLIEDSAQIIDRALHPDFLDIAMIDESAGMLRIYSATYMTDRLILPLEKGVTGLVVATGKTSRIPDVSLEPSYLAVNPGVRSELCVPLKIGKHVIGAINIESKKLNAFTDAYENMMTIFAGQLVTAIEKVRLFQSEQRHAREAETLRQAGAIVAATLRQDEAIDRILIQLERVVPYDSASVQLLRDGYLEIVGGRGWPDPAAVVGMRFPIPGDNPNTIVIQERRTYILGDAPSVHVAFSEGPHNHIHSFLGVPLIVGDQVIGMLAVDNTKPNFFTPDHARLVAAFADQVALAIQNTRLFSEVQKLASTDSLTGLHNRRHFMEISRREFARAQRYQHPLIAIMLDIDHFKQVNDTYGHAVGDQALKIVATRCKKIVRQIDVLGRYGGDEFVSLLLETDPDGALIVAERLRHCMVDLSIDTDQGPLAITISIGIAILDEKCKALDDLLHRADQALYIAKQAGRNQVFVWQN